MSVEIVEEEESIEEVKQSQEIISQTKPDNHTSEVGTSIPLSKRTKMICHPWHAVSWKGQSDDEIRAIIEIPALSRVKTELDKETGLLKVDRILHSSVIYPANYGFIPQSLAKDDDPLDILVLCQLSVPPLSIMRVRPIGLIPMDDCGEQDDKIIAVAATDPEYNIYYDITELPPFKLLMITQFFNDYKTLERKTVKIFKPLGSSHAIKVIQEALNNYKARFSS